MGCARLLGLVEGSVSQLAHRCGAVRRPRSFTSSLSRRGTRNRGKPPSSRQITRGLNSVKTRHWVVFPSLALLTAALGLFIRLGLNPASAQQAVVNLAPPLQEGST